MSHAAETDPNREQWLKAAPFTLALSGGYFGHFAHAGLLMALAERQLVPARIVGVSAGALTGGLFAAGIPAAELADEMRRTRRSDFWDRAFPWVALLPGRRFDAMLRRLLEPRGVSTFKDCAIPFASVACDLRMRTVVLESGTLRTAIRASCAIPPLFRPIRHDGRRLWDGAMRDRFGFAAISDTERVLVHALPHRPGPSGRRPALPDVADTDRRRVLIVADLPKISPHRMDLGAQAIDQTREAARHWLRA